MAQSTRDMPIRADGWRPTDPVVEAIINRCLDDVDAGGSRDGVRELMAGAMILVVLAAALMMAGQSPAVALLIPAALFAAVAIYVVANAEPVPVDHSEALEPMGGPGRLPAGYLVHPGAWKGGMAAHVAYVPESQLRAAADMCAAFPGSVDRLLQFTGTIAAQFPHPDRHLTPEDVENRAHELVLAGLPMIKAFNDQTPQPQLGGKKGKKK
jgi:hypothetical protein